MEVGQLQSRWFDLTSSFFHEVSLQITNVEKQRQKDPDNFFGPFFELPGLIFYHGILLLDEKGFLDNQFTQLKQLQDESNPNFVFEVVTLFFDDSEKILSDLGRALDQQTVDFEKVDAHVHQLKGSSSSIGAQRVKNVCIAFRNFCDANNKEGCLSCLQQVKHECSLTKNKLESLFRLEQQILAAGGSIPMIEL